MDREEWIQEYIRQQIGGMVFGSELERQHMMERARRAAENTLMAQEQTQQKRNELIATIQRNRMNAGKLGHKGVRPVSHSDLIELNKMSMVDLEQTAKLTWQLTQPVVKQPEGELGEREKWIREYIRQQINGMVFGSELQKQHAIEQARRKAEAHLMGRPQGNTQEDQHLKTAKIRIAMLIAQRDKGADYRTLMIKPFHELMKEYRKWYRR